LISLKHGATYHINNDDFLGTVTAWISFCHDTTNHFCTLFMNVHHLFGFGVWEFQAVVDEVSLEYNFVFSPAKLYLVIFLHNIFITTPRCAIALSVQDFITSSSLSLELHL
jgi:hypothetical protein